MPVLIRGIFSGGGVKSRMLQQFRRMLHKGKYFITMTENKLELLT